MSSLLKELMEQQEQEKHGHGHQFEDGSRRVKREDGQDTHDDRPRRHQKDNEKNRSKEEQRKLKKERKRKRKRSTSPSFLSHGSSSKPSARKRRSSTTTSDDSAGNTTATPSLTAADYSMTMNRGSYKQEISNNNDTIQEHENEIDDDDEEEIELTFDTFESRFLGNGDDDDEQDDGKNRHQRRRLAGGKAVMNDPFYQTYPETLKVLYYGDDGEDDHNAHEPPPDDDHESFTSKVDEPSNHNSNDKNKKRRKTSSAARTIYKNDSIDKGIKVSDIHEGQDESSNIDEKEDHHGTSRSIWNDDDDDNDSADDRDEGDLINGMHENKRLEIIHKVLQPRPPELSMLDDIQAEEAASVAADAAAAAAGGGDVGSTTIDKKLQPNFLEGVGTSTKVTKHKTRRYQPRRKRDYVPKTKAMMNSRRFSSGLGQNFPVYRFETPEEIQQRVDGLERSAEILGRHRRVQRRKINFQDDSDVGHAFAARADAYLKDRLVKEKREKRILQKVLEKKRKREERERQRQEEEKQKQEEEERHHRQEEEDKLEDDDSVQEQNYLLSQLTENSGGGPNGVSKQESRGLSSESISSRSKQTTTSKSLSYWEEGHALPFKENLSYNFNPSVEQMMNHPSKDKFEDSDDETKNGDDCSGAVTAPLKVLTGGLNAPSIVDPFYYMEPNWSRGISGFLNCHIRQMIVMAAKSLCGHPRKGKNGDDSVQRFENGYSRLLLATSRKNVYSEGKKGEQVEQLPLSNFSNEYYRALYATQMGENVLLYSKNVWNDPTKVVQNFGMLDSRESPLSGSTMAKRPIQASWGSIQTKMKKAYRARAREWSHAASTKNDSIDMTMEQNEEESTSSTMKSGSELLELPTSAGVMNSKSRSSTRILGGSGFTDSERERQSLLVSPNCLWAHIPGTNPPVPQMPLDPLGILFGPSDRHSKFHKGNARVSNSSFNLILSMLIQRISTRINDPKRMAETQNEVMSLIYEYINIHTTEMHVRWNRLSTSTRDDIPLVYMYIGLMSFCSFVASGCPSLEMGTPASDDADDNAIQNGWSDSKHHDEVDDESFGEAQESNPSSSGGRVRFLHDTGMNKVAEKIWDFCRINVTLNGLLRFPKPRVTFAISSICKILPRSAAEILSRPLDTLTTPLDLFKETLAHLEEKRMIHQSKHYAEEEMIHVGELEYIFHEAADMFNEAVRLDCLNSEYHLWHIGCLASCLLLSSGNRISERANVFPSQRTPSDSSNGPSHEVRNRLSKYVDVRCELSAAVSLLLELTNYQRSSRAHFGVASFLEWSQAIALLVGRTLEERIDSVRRVHNFHIRQWSEKESPETTTSLPTDSRRMVSDVGLYARQLESDPANLHYWKELIQHLGMINDNSYRPGSQTPNLRRNENSSKWWGVGRDWWLTSFLYIPALDNVSAEEKVVEIKKLKDLLSTAGETGNMDDADRQSSSHANNMNDMDRLSDYDKRNKWLPSISDIESEDLGQNASIRERSKCYLKHLPRSIVPSKTRGTHTNDGPTRHDPTMMEDITNNHSSAFPTASQDAEILAYKIFIAVKLVGPGHEAVQNGLYALAKTLENEDNNDDDNGSSDCVAVIKWLRSKGLDILSLGSSDG